MKTEIQYRSYPGELRTSGPSLRGYAAVFNSLSADLGGFREKIVPGAFKRSIEGGADVRALLNHDPNIILGRTTAGTLTLKEDAHGLHVIITPPNTQAARDLRETISRGDLNQMSFGFRVRKDDWETRDGEKIRTLIDLDLYDVSPVTFPAYQSTVIAARHRSNNMNSELRPLYEERARIVEQQRKLLDSGKDNGEEYNNLEVAYADVGAKIRDAEARERRQRELDLAEAELRQPQNEAIRPMPTQQRGRRPEPELAADDGPNPFKHMVVYEPGTFKRLFRAPQMTAQQRRDTGEFLSRGLVMMSDAAKSRMVNPVEIRRTLQADKDIVGGFLVQPEAFTKDLVMDLRDSLFVWDRAKIISMPYAAAVSFPVLSDTIDDANWTAELRTGSEDASMDFEKLTLSPHPLAKRVKVSETLIRRTGDWAGEIVRSELSYKFGVTLEKSFMVGTGGGQPVGLFTAAPAGGAGISTSRDVSTFNSATEIKSDCLLETVGTLRAQWRKNASWIFSRAAMNQIRRLKDGGGNYLWSPSLSAGTPDRLLSYPVFESEFCPSTMTSGLYVGLFGDLRYYFIAVALDFRVAVLSELYAETGEIGYIGRMEVDAAPVRENAFVRIQLA